MKASGFAGELWTQADSALPPDHAEWTWPKAYGIQIQGGAHQNGLGKSVMHYGCNSGYQAINLAWLRFKPARIVLIGYDMSLGEDGKRHFFGDHPPALNVTSAYHNWTPLFKALAEDLKAEGVEVVNCSRKTAITAFPRQSLESVL